MVPSRAMIAARSIGGGVSSSGHPPHHVASLSGNKVHHSISLDAKRSSYSGNQGAQHRNKTAVMREMEASWHQKMFGLSKEDTVAHKTGMPYRSVNYCGFLCLNSALRVVCGAELLVEAQNLLSPWGKSPQECSHKHTHTQTHMVFRTFCLL